MVARAIALFDKVGMEAAFDRFTNHPIPDFNHDDLYIFVGKIDTGVPIVAHAHDRSGIGLNTESVILLNGRNLGHEVRAKATSNGTWFDYKWKDPLTGKIVEKSSWIVLHKGYIFGCGIHKP